LDLRVALDEASFKRFISEAILKNMKRNLPEETRLVISKLN